MGRGYVQQVFIEQKYVRHVFLDRCSSGVGLARSGVSNLGRSSWLRKGIQEEPGSDGRVQMEGGRSDLCGTGFG